MSSQSSGGNSGNNGLGLSLSISCCILMLVLTAIILYYFRCDLFKSECDKCKWDFLFQSGCPDSPSPDATSGTDTTPTPPPPPPTGSGSPPGSVPAPSTPSSGQANINGHVFPIIRSKYSVGKGYIWSPEHLGKPPYITPDAATCESDCSATDNPWCEHWGFEVATKLCYLKNNKTDETVHIRGIKKAKMPTLIDSLWTSAAETANAVGPEVCMQRCEDSNDCVAWIHRDSNHSQTQYRNTCALFPSKTGPAYSEGFAVNTPWADSPWSHDSTKYTTLSNFNYNSSITELASFDNQRDAEEYSESHPECSGYVTNGTTYSCKGSMQTTNASDPNSTSYLKKSRTTFPVSTSTGTRSYFRIRNENTSKYVTAVNYVANQRNPVQLQVLVTSDDHQIFYYDSSTKEIVPKSNIASALNVDQGNTGAGSIIIADRPTPTNAYNTFSYPDDGNFQIIVENDSSKRCIQANADGRTTNAGGTKNNNNVAGGFHLDTKNVFFIEPVM